jgi:hypothetical protein
MKQGSRIIVNGKYETVFKIEPLMIFTFESMRKNTWYHPTKVTEVLWSQKLKRWVTIPD